MSARSSSDSWPGGGERAPDIIDLDRYMRGSVRPHGRHRANDDCDRLVVDAGGPTAASGGPVGLPPGPIGGNLGGPAPSPRPKSSSTVSVPRDKRYSHDSGLSDGSYNARRRMHHSRRVVGDHATTRAHRDRGRGREMVTSSHSMRNFRVACERALKDQQEQIARMAQLCERLTVKNERVASRATAPKQTSVTVTQDTSDISSSSLSRSTRDKLRKDKHRTNECKTYKIIMNKLDELNRMFATRNRSIPPRRKAIAPARVSSAGSVSMSDKLVSTEPMDRHYASRPPRSITAYAALTEVRPVLVSPRTPLSAGYSSSQKRAPSLVERGVGARRNCRAAITRLATTQAHELDIAPVEAVPRHPARSRSGRLNVATESVVEHDSAADGSNIQSPQCKFDLDNPLHLYEQSKRLQNPQKRVRSVEQESARPNPIPAKSNKSRDHTHHVSLCGRCYGYWRALTQLIYGPDKAPNASSSFTCEMS